MNQSEYMPAIWRPPPALITTYHFFLLRRLPCNLLVVFFRNCLFVVVGDLAGVDVDAALIAVMIGAASALLTSLTLLIAGWVA